MHRKIAISLFLGCCALGCSGANSQLTRCQQDKDQLLATIREQRDANRTLHEQVASLETRLDESEKELARQGKPGTRISSRPAPEKTPLPWRSPAPGASDSVTPLKPPLKSSNTSPARGATKLASHQQSATDAQPGMTRFDAEIPFDGKTAELTAEGRNRLDDLAKWLKSKDAADKQVSVAGEKARARAVVDYLDSHGIAEGRLAVKEQRSPGSGVEILVSR